MKIGIVSQWYPPEPAFIPASLAEELAARGHEVRVLTGFPNYPVGVIYPGYRQQWNAWSTTGRITTRRVPLYPSHDSSAARRIATYASFAATSSVAAVRYLAGVDALYVYHPPATAFAPAALLRLLYRVPAVLHVQDIWPESVTASPMGPRPRGLVDRALGLAMRQIYRMAHSIAVIAPSMRDLVVERGADPARVRVVLNWADESLFRPVEATEEARREIGYRGRCTVMHAGNIGPFQNICGAIRAAASVERASGVDLVLVGSGIAEGTARTLVADLGATNVRFLGRQEPARMAALYAAADYQLVSLLDLPIFRGTIPSKLQAALSCGSPVVVSAPGDCAGLVERNGVGLSCPPEDWRALADRFVRAASFSPAEHAEMRRRARASYEAHMSKRAGVDELEKMLKAAARGEHR
ncbi:glycosyltransferase family 4 protein [Micromonospora sp. CPCC 206061]|uniref:glycosyltransferase family 4 protein n=1 Tax=Micromonospora sp. CPCC 206061 TaxID=3122410 RepID=UPI002FEE9C34